MDPSKIMAGLSDPMGQAKNLMENAGIGDAMENIGDAMGGVGDAVGEVFENDQPVLGDNEEVEHESGATRMKDAICGALCGAPLMLLVMIFLLGWNEKRAVCTSKAIIQGKHETTEVSCDSATGGDGKLVLFTCDLKKDGLQPFVTGTSWDQVLYDYVGTGLNVSSQMLQCYEQVTSRTKKDKVGGGKTTVKTYTYGKRWSSKYIDSSEFRKRTSQSFIQGCGSGAQNPTWPADTPQSKEFLATSVKVGAFTIGETYIWQIPLKTQITITNSTLPTGWNGSNPFEMQYNPSTATDQIGDMRMTFYGNDWANPKVTVLGRNSGGNIDEWVAKDSWLCSGYSLADLRTGMWGKDKLFKELANQNTAITWLLRLLGFICGWVAFSLLFGPLEVMADCIPFIGPYLGDSISFIAGILACPPACACSLCIIGIVWVAMRPLVGGAMMTVFVCIMCCFGAFKFSAKNPKDDEETGERDSKVQVVGNTGSGETE